MLPEHHATQMFNPQAIQTHYQHPAMTHAMVSLDNLSQIVFIRHPNILELETEL